MDKNINVIDSRVLSIGISIPLLFTVLIQISYILENFNPMWSIVMNLDTFSIFWLVFVSGITIAILSKAKMKTGILNGAILGFIVELISIFVITLFALLNNPEFQVNQIITWNFGTYLMFNLIFMSFTGSVGGIIGSIIIKFKK